MINFFPTVKTSINEVKRKEVLNRLITIFQFECEETNDRVRSKTTENKN